MWPPPNHPDEESDREITSNSNTPHNDPSTLARDSLVMMTDSNLNYINKMKSAEENVSSSKQMTELSSDTKFESALMATTQATSKSEFVVQSQKSQMIQEMSSCTVQSFSEQATSESQNYSLYQHKANDKFDANAQITKKSLEQLIDSQENQSLSSMKNEFNVSNVTERIPQDITITNQKEFNKGCNIQLSKVKQQTSFKSTETGNKASELSSKTFKPLPTQNNPPMKMGSKSENKENSSSFTSKPSPNIKVKTVSSLKVKPSKADDNLTTQKGPVTERRSLIDALTIAPDRPYSPLSFNIPNPISTPLDQAQISNSELIHPMPTQTTTSSTFSQSDQSQFSHENRQNINTFPISSEPSAFKPVSKQTFPPPQPEEFSEVCKTAYKDTKSSALQNQQQSFSPITCQNYAIQSNKQNTLSSSEVTIKSGVHRSESIPPYQQNLENMPIQGVLASEQNKVLVTNPGIGQGEIPMSQRSEIHQARKPVKQNFDGAQSMSRNSPVHSRPTTPSLINKPPPIIPHYQMNLVTVEHVAPEGRMYKPCTDEASRSSTPKVVSPSPATVPVTASNSLKAQAPRIKDSMQNHNFRQNQSSSEKFISSKKEEYEMNLQDSNVKKWLQQQPPLVKEEQQSNLEHHTETYNRGDAQIKEDAVRNQHYSQRQMESQNDFEHGSTIVEATKTTYEEFESAQSAKTIEIRQGSSQSSNIRPQIKPNVQPSNSNLKQVYPPPISQDTMSSQQNLSFNTTNANVAITSNQTEVYQPTPFISGANQGPVCDPTPSTGSSVGAAARGKAFGVSSAPKRGRGVLNKAALPGSRVPLCASCNGNIR